MNITVLNNLNFDCLKIFLRHVYDVLPIRFILRYCKWSDIRDYVFKINTYSISNFDLIWWQQDTNTYKQNSEKKKEIIRVTPYNYEEISEMFYMATVSYRNEFMGDY